MRYGLLAAGLAVFAGGHATAQETLYAGADTRTNLSLTIYNNDMALVRDSRQIAFKTGQQRLELSGLPKLLEPETFVLAAKDIKVIERNFDFDLLTPQSILERAVGQTVHIYRTHPQTGEDRAEEAKVLATNSGVVLEIDGRIETLGALPGRIVFDSLPQGLRIDPALSMLVDVEKPGTRDVDLTYFTGGLSWQADYVGVLSSQRDRMDLTGWVTLTNRSGTDFSDVDTQLVAGDVNRNRPRIMSNQFKARGVAYAEMASDAVAQESLMAYHLYSLPNRTDIADRQTKQVHFMDAPKVKVEQRYRYETAQFSSLENPVPADVYIHFQNDSKTGPGVPLPGGTVRLYLADSAGRLQFVGEDVIQHIAEGQRVNMVIGRAFDVTVTPTSVVRTVVEKSRDKQVTDITQRYLVESTQSEAVTFSLVQSVYNTGWELLDESIAHSDMDASSITWNMKVPAKGSVMLEFSVRTTS